MAKSKKFGTFGGVFTPSILTILGVIMYMRLPMISGEAGLVGTLGIIFVAHLISITTGLSVSSIATDKKVKEGGTYYIISRSLGLPIGGTLGLALFVGLSFSVSLYLIGFSESFLSYWDLPMDINQIRITGSIILLVVSVITFISTSLAIKTQYLIMGAIILSLLSIFFGRHDLAPVSPNFFGSGTGVSLIVLFGIFFPAVTGFEAGVSMSGDLKDPKKSIPLGTISAIAIGLVVYIGLAFFFAFTVDGNLLATDSKALFKIALVPQLVIAGIWGATLSSALGSILAAPRILQSTAIDKITPRIFARGTGQAKEPRNALILTFLIAEAGILIGELDVIARIVSIFFITTYGFLNLSAAFESLTSADFRPSFRTPPWVSIVGFIACFLVMIQLDVLAMLGAILILGTLFLILKRRQLVLETGDAWSSVWATLVRTGLQRLNIASLQTRNWRPNIILFSGKENERQYLIELAKAFCGRLGMFSAFEMVQSDEKRLAKVQRYQSASAKDNEVFIHQHKCRNIYEGMDEISRIYGFSGIEPDTILMGWSNDSSNKEQFLGALKNFEESDFNSILMYYDHLKKFGNRKTIDVWWNGWGSNLTFSIFLLRHFTSSGEWKDATIRLLVINTLPERTEAIYTILQQILIRYRINLEIKVIGNRIEGMSKQEIIIRESSGTDLTFIGIPDKQYQDIGQTYEEVRYLTQYLGTFLLINSSSRFESFDLRLDGQHKGEKKVSAYIETDLPELTPSKFVIVNEDIKKIDARGQEILTDLFEKSIAPTFSGIQKLSDELLSVINTVFGQLNLLKDLNESYERRKRLIKIKNDFFFRLKRIFEEIDNKKLITQKEALTYGINRYIDQLDQYLLEFPAKIEIPYSREDLILKKNDHFSLKLFKLRKRLAHPFTKKSIPVRIRYHEIAAYYLRDTRHNYLSAYLANFQNDILLQFSEIRAIIISADNLLNSFFNEVAGDDEFMNTVTEDQKNNENRVYALISSIALLQEKLLKRLIVEFRKNLQLMSNDLGKIDINYLIRRKRRKKRFYEELIRKNSGFGEVWHEETMLQVNRIHMDVLLRSFKSHIRNRIIELNLKVGQLIDNRLIMELQRLRSNLERYGDRRDNIEEIKLAINSAEESVPLMKEFNIFGKEIIKLSESLPEVIEISASLNSDKGRARTHDPLEVPLRRITRFYLESSFIGNTHDQLMIIGGSLKNSISVINDLLSLTRFNLENIPQELPDISELITPVINEACQKIVSEEENIAHTTGRIDEVIESNLEELFDKLSTYKIPETLSEYSWFIREHKGKRVKKKFHAYLDNIKIAFRNITTRVLYSRSEWILLARKIMESDSKSAVTQKVLDLVELVSPKENVIGKLPQFYKNLFNGRSSINEDYWISREKDEEMFRTAVQRNINGYNGGIIIVGERNSGKTAFCRNITGRLFKKEQIYHLFPIYYGSTSVSDFVGELSRITNIQGGIKEMMEILPHGSVIVIHDLELWWERSSNGWEIIRLLISIINEFSNRILFIVNINPYAFDLINKMTNLKDVFISVITLRPFDSREIHEIIIRRHRSSGLKFYLNNTDEDDILEIKIARLFNKYFNYSEGNPGIALMAWLANIDEVSDKKVFIHPPGLPDINMLVRLDEEWKIILINLVLHKRLTFERIARIFYSDDTNARNVLSSMLRAGLLEERRENLYVINNYIESHVIRALKSEELL